MSRLGLALCAVALCVGTAGAAAPTQVHYVMGTWLRITADDAPATRVAMAACFTDAQHLDRTFSRWSTTSELALVHARAGAPTPVSDDFAALMGRALALRTVTAGRFDPTVGPLMALWRASEPPTPAALAAARRRTGADAVALAGATVTLADGARLDFDGIAKGFAVDRCVARLRAAGTPRALVSFGESSVAAVGAPADADAWTLEVRGTDPETVVGTVALRDAALSVSAVRPDGGRAHIVDPQTGRLLARDAVAVVVAASATDAEAWSKAILVDGPSRLAADEARGSLRALWLDADGARPGPRMARAHGFAAWDAPRRLAAAAEPLR